MDKEWSASEKLPRGFSEWLKETVKEQERDQRKVYSSIANELGISPSILSRWIGGMGPLNQNDIQSLASIYGEVVYTYLHIPRPNSY
jgi:hypothetical protein